MTNTIKDLWTDIDSKYTYSKQATRDFIREVANQFQSCLYIEYTPHDEIDWDGIVNTLGNLGLWLEDEPYVTPDYYFGLAAYGHFKETYNVSRHYVMKLCTRRNPTSEEKALLDRAADAELSEFFAPTLFFNLPVTRVPAVLEEEDPDDVEYNPIDHCWELREDYEPDNTICAVEFQPVIDIYLPYDNADWTEFNVYDKESPLYSKYPTLDRSDVRGLDGAAERFVMDFAAYYGLTALIALSDFCLEYHVTDLHEANVGTLALYDGDALRPVILDWLSR